MQCLYCGNFDEQVLRSREDIKNNQVVRVRICLSCGAKLPTKERIDTKVMKSINPTRKLPGQQ